MQRQPPFFTVVKQPATNEAVEIIDLFPLTCSNGDGQTNYTFISGTNYAAKQRNRPTSYADIDLHGRAWRCVEHRFNENGPVGGIKDLDPVNRLSQRHGQTMVDTH